MRIQRMAALVVLSVLAVVGSPVATMANAAAPPGGSALAPVSPAAYAELSAKWWQWAASTPFTDDGPFGQASTDCGENQPQGNVFFLAGQFSAQPAERTSVIPAGKRLLLPIINVECSSLEAAPFRGVTVAARRACVEHPLFAFSDLAATLDGQPIVPDLADFEVTSPNFPIVAVPNNPAIIPPGSGFSVSKGVWLLLAPLSPGVHEISFTGNFAGLNFRPTATYHLTIQ